jgi:BirA family biotin operon repressor/biotin-[acetyl-CoA-carboxylase] ligase
MQSMEGSLFTGQNEIYLTEIPSTNIYAMELLSKTSPPEGTCIFADYQSAGRGQIGRYWHSEAGKNLLISYIFYPEGLDLSHQFYLNIMSGLALLETVKPYFASAKLKWPNDVYAGDRKLAGILVQNILRGQHIRATIVGMGLNVNEIQFPAEVPNPVSLAQLTGTENDLSLIRMQLSKKLEQYYLILKKGKYSQLMTEYRENLYRIHKESLFTDADGVSFAGRITGVDEQGRLQIRHSENGQLAAYNFREITYVI